MKKNIYYILVSIDGATFRKRVSGYKIDDSTMVYSLDHSKWVLVDVPTGASMLSYYPETRSKTVEKYYEYYKLIEEVRATESYHKGIERLNNTPLYPEF